MLSLERLWEVKELMGNKTRVDALTEEGTGAAEGWGAWSRGSHSEAEGADRKSGSTYPLLQAQLNSTRPECSYPAHSQLDSATGGKLPLGTVNNCSLRQNHKGSQQDINVWGNKCACHSP